MNKSHCIESLKDLATHCYVATVDLETINYAIKSIEAWDRVIEEIKEHCAGTKDNSCKFCYRCNSLLGVSEVLDILKKHMEEVEQCQHQ